MTRRTVLVTGAAGALGRAVVAALAEQGDALALLDRDGALLREAYGDPSAGRLLVPCDLRDAAGVETAVRRIAAESPGGAVDAVCHLAGGFTMGEPVRDLSDRTWNAMMDVNVRSFLHVARAVVPPMRAAGRGRIVAVGSLAAAHAGPALQAAYAASKRALQAVVESLSAEEREHGIGVNAVLPSIIDTPANRAAMPDADPARWVAADDLARVVRFLLSDDARAVHGASVPVRGLS